MNCTGVDLNDGAYSYSERTCAKVVRMDIRNVSCAVFLNNILGVNIPPSWNACILIMNNAEVILIIAT